ncbi:MAG: acyl carrier protein [Pleurocapsa sp. MO_192.B19]|nr:acyl carrier protein [Pleurocapsa sp. MO_192.B19]
MTEQLKQKTQNVILELLPNVERQNLGDETDIFSLGLDSINAMSLIFSLQDAFDVKFETDEISFDNFQTVTKIVELIEKKQGIKQEI